MPPLDSANPFNEAQLCETVERELLALGWIENFSDTIRERVIKMIGVLKGDRLIRGCLEAPEPNLEQALGYVCLARRSRLDNHRALWHDKLAEIEVRKSKQESLPETLYPLVYLQMLEQAEIPVLDAVRASFMQRLAVGGKFSKKAMIEVLEVQLASHKVHKNISQEIAGGVSKLLTCHSGRKRLGELLYDADEDKLQKWNEKFPHESLQAIQTKEMESLETVEQIVSDFLKSVKYFAGNPHIAPGVFTAFKCLWSGVAGPSQLDHVKLEKTSKAFVVKIRGAHSVDLERVRRFISELESEWAQKYPTEPTLKVELETQTDGGSGGTWMDI